MMIQVNNTSPFGKQHAVDNFPQPSGKQSDAGFQNALSAALSSTLKEFGIDPNQVTLVIAPSAAPAPAPVTPFSKSLAIASLQPSVTTQPTTAGTPASTDSAGAPQDDIASIISFDNAYWAKQPPAVQALRKIDDYNQRVNLASELSAQGYSIDVPIMVWGWDPAKITAARQGYGYSWVPAAGQAPVAEAPGVAMPGVTPYDPANRPAGSIAV